MPSHGCTVMFTSPHLQIHVNNQERVTSIAVCVSGACKIAPGRYDQRGSLPPRLKGLGPSRRGVARAARRRRRIGTSVEFWPSLGLCGAPASTGLVELISQSWFPARLRDFFFVVFLLSNLQDLCHWVLGIHLVRISIGWGE